MKSFVKISEFLTARWFSAIESYLLCFYWANFGHVWVATLEVSSKKNEVDTIL
jgi:hypothetical protein